MAQRLAARFAHVQRVAAHHNAEILLQFQGFQQFYRQQIAFVGHHGQGDAQRFQQAQSGFGFGIRPRLVGNMVGIIPQEHFAAALEQGQIRLTMLIVGQGAVHQNRNAVAHVTAHRCFGQPFHTQNRAHFVGGGSQIGHGIHQSTIQIKSHGLNVRNMNHTVSPNG